ncbi:hypothetical protein CK516_12555, partial [Nostoc sp. 'Peltigera malacea cyanobiont' DB3992]
MAKNFPTKIFTCKVVKSRFFSGMFGKPDAIEPPNSYPPLAFMPITPMIIKADGNEFDECGRF